MDSRRPLPLGAIGAFVTLLDVHNLQTEFRTPEGTVRAVDGLSFSIGAGETVALLGESGCGKSVTAFSILRLLKEPPARVMGEVRFERRNLLSLKKRDLRAIRGNEIIWRSELQSCSSSSCGRSRSGSQLRAAYAQRPPLSCSHLRSPW